MSSAPPITIDGSRGEGGGQILRNAITYAAILSRSVTITNVRAGRSKPGLRPQHLTGIRLAARICGGRLEGDEVGSCEVRYEPPPGIDASSAAAAAAEADDRSASEPIIGDTGTAGSVCLLLQAALPCALFSPRSASSSQRRRGPTQLELRGGTNADMAPQIDYLTSVFLPIATSALRLPEVQIDIDRRGYYPRGGGIVRVSIPRLEGGIKPITMTERGEVTSVHVRSFHAGKCPRWVAQKIADSAVRALRRGSTNLVLPKHLRPTVAVVTEPRAVGSGSGVLIAAHTATGCILAGSALGRPKVKPERTGEDAASELMDALTGGGCVDSWLQDQLVLYMALAGGTSEIATGCLTLHTQTAIMVAEQLTGAAFEVTRIEDGKEAGVTPDATEMVTSNVYGASGLVMGRHRIRCKGMGFAVPVD